MIIILVHVLHVIQAMNLTLLIVLLTRIGIKIVKLLIPIKEISVGSAIMGILLSMECVRLRILCVGLLIGIMGHV
jgi:hypothetical protein